MTPNNDRQSNKVSLILIPNNDEKSNKFSQILTHKFEFDCQQISLMLTLLTAEQIKSGEISDYIIGKRGRFKEPIITSFIDY